MFTPEGKAKKASEDLDLFEQARQKKVKQPAPEKPVEKPPVSRETKAPKKDYPDLKPKAGTREVPYETRWDSHLKLGRKAQFVIEAGWTNAKGKMTKLGEKIAESSWKDLSPAAKNILEKKIDEFYKTEKPKAEKGLKEGEVKETKPEMIAAIDKFLL